jgi:hypothetical protein
MIGSVCEVLGGLFEWLEKQDKFQEDILRRVQVIERKLDIRPEA